jgi:hypothetical protein
MLAVLWREVLDFSRWFDQRIDSVSVNLIRFSKLCETT